MNDPKGGKLISDGEHQYLVVPLVAVGAASLASIHTIEIGFDQGTPVIKTQPKEEFPIGPNDSVEWICDAEFIVRFLEGKVPDTSKGDSIFGSTLDSRIKRHRRVVAFAGNPVGTKLVYEVLVKVTPEGKWQSADPSIIIDQGRRVFGLVKVDKA